MLKTLLKLYLIKKIGCIINGVDKIGWHHFLITLLSNTTRVLAFLYFVLYLSKITLLSNGRPYYVFKYVVLYLSKITLLSNLNKI